MEVVQHISLQCPTCLRIKHHSHRPGGRLRPHKNSYSTRSPIEGFPSADSNDIAHPDADAIEAINPQMNVDIQSDLLRYHGALFRPNDRAYLFDHGSRCSIKIVGITPMEVTVQRTDGSRTKIPIKELEDGGVILGLK
ncbi:hypothetical protein BC832DRAFT_339963 [Gaertneriomyces semiglobifer]|nr:hypothetical protein BC832DRAFT_339963 [Gaertneriomyces semiglobifer]